MKFQVRLSDGTLKRFENVVDFYFSKGYLTLAFPNGDTWTDCNIVEFGTVA